MKSDSLSAGVSPVSRAEGIGTTDIVERRKVISDRLESLSEVEDGWFEGRGVALDRAGLLWLDNQMADHYLGTDLPLPHLYPLESGGVIGEWSLERFECAIEIDLQARTGLWVDVDLETGEGIDERVLDLSDDTDWDWMVGRLRRFVDQA